MAELPRPLEQFFDTMIPAIKTRRGAQSLVIGLAEGSLNEVVLEQLNWLISPKFAEALSASSSNIGPRTEHLLKQDAVVFASVWNYTIELCGNLALTSLGYESPPCAFLRLLSPAASAREAALRDLKKSWGSLEKAEIQGQSDHQCAAIVRDTTIGLQQFNRELFIQLLETNFEVVPEAVQLAISEYGGSWFSSLVAECGFNECRRVGRRGRNRRMEPARVYHTLAVGSDLMSSFDRPSIPITQAARCVASGGKLPSTAFGIEYSEDCSLSPEMLDELQSKKPSWPTMSPHSLQLAAASWKMLVELGGDWQRMQWAWLSLLVAPKMVVLNLDMRQSFLVLKTTPSGFIGWRAPLLNDRSIKFAPSPAQACKFLIVEDPSRWKAAYCRFGRKDPSPSTNAFMQGVPQVGANSGGLLVTSCRAGFPQMTVHYMKKLLFEHVARDWSGPRPSSEASVLTELCKRILGDDATNAAINDAMRARHVAIAPPQVEDGGELLKDFQSVVEDFEVDESDDEDVHRQVAEWQAAYNRQVALQTERVHAVEQAQRQMGAAAAAASSGASSSSAAPPARRPRRFVPMAPSGPSQDEANNLLPEGYKVSKDDRRENRWRLRGPHIGGDKKLQLWPLQRPDSMAGVWVPLSHRVEGSL